MFARDSNHYDGPDPIDKDAVVVCTSDHNDDVLNQPYQKDAVPGEVATPDRPIIKPKVAALGVSAFAPLNTYKVGFGYDTVQWYEPFAEKGVGPITDPQHFHDHVMVKYRADQPGVARVNDFDEFGEEFNDPHTEKSGYGQPVVFHKNGDDFAYLHKSLPGTVDGGAWPVAFQEAFADQTSAAGLLTFTAKGDLPLKWTIKPSLAPTNYSRDVTVDAAFLAKWESDWQAYYKGGPKPPMPLAPGTNSPAPDIEVVVNPPEKAVTVNPPGPAPAEVVQVPVPVLVPAPAAAPVERVVTNTVTVTKTVVVKKAKSAKQRAACMRTAKRLKGKKRAKAMRRCRAS